MKLLTEGDSFGTRWKVDTAWPDLVQQHLGCVLVNNSVTGSSNKDITERLRVSIPEHQPDIVLVILTDQLRDYKKLSTNPLSMISSADIWTPEQYVRDYLNHINEILSMHKNVLLIQGLPWNNSGVKEQEIRIEWELQKNNSYFLYKESKDNFIDFEDDAYNYMYTNGMLLDELMKGHGHPNEKGHQYIAERFINELDKKTLFQN